MEWDSCDYPSKLNINATHYIFNSKRMLKVYNAYVLRYLLPFDRGLITERPQRNKLKSCLRLKVLI